MQNPFLRVLRASFDAIYRSAAERGEATAVIVPCADCLETDNFSETFVETHVLYATHVPGFYMNLLGQGIEISDASVTTDLGFADVRVCKVLQAESMYDYGNNFRILVTDRPLVGKFRVAHVVEPGTTRLEASDWLNSAPAVMDELFDQVDRFRKTFVQVPGCEQSTAERIREMCDEAKKRLIRHHKLRQLSEHRQVEYQVSRAVYAALHSFVFPHLQRILEEAEQRLTGQLNAYSSTRELAQREEIGLLDVRASAELLGLLDHKITPHEKIEAINEAHTLLQKALSSTTAGPGSQATDGQGRDSRQEITGDDVMSAFILAVHASPLQHRLAHVAHVEMYLQGAGGSEARFEEAGYAVTALQSALQFFLQGDRRPRATIFSSYLHEDEARRR